MPLGPSDSPMLVWVCACVCMRVHACVSHAEAARCWQGCHIKPMALNSLCQLLQAAIDAPIM